MNKTFVYQVGNNKKSYTMMHGQPNIKMKGSCLFYNYSYKIVIVVDEMR